MRARRFTPERPSALPRRRSWLAACFAATSILLAVTAHGLAPGAKAPPIDGHDLNGKPVSLAALRGKVVIIDFMACWCAPCKAELPRLNDFYLRYRAQGVVVIGVAVDQGLDTVRSLSKRFRSRSVSSMIPSTSRSNRMRHRASRAHSSSTNKESFATCTRSSLRPRSPPWRRKCASCSVEVH